MFKLHNSSTALSYKFEEDYVLLRFQMCFCYLVSILYIFKLIYKLWVEKKQIKDSFIFIYIYQQFITWSVRVACGSYFVTTYKRGRHTWSRKKEKDKKKDREKKKTNWMSRIKEKEKEI